jgi:hypothetical protein
MLERQITGFGNTPSLCTPRRHAGQVHIQLHALAALPTEQVAGRASELRTVQLVPLPLRCSILRAWACIWFLPRRIVTHQQV